ncbi:DUF305 domain-containing protein [Paracoccus sp. R12_1]|jgi:uncharacterized protein (DUF305 family)|uniref:DUF305 domain-containing protein n=1 Tax=unclassified Paracoccus (in: a-proteobacteria) TaxID=2688777 RepID=UPI001ADB332F|nr:MULTISPECIES: DUF305 domain-containing protein [unclassified Paracoccus (in: a-proteobacteria)]MBO9457424.1 DUF305 domain-containing protein [Paracoccus sp. R12_2]MBO9488716.1 DUF305 domain-containing protein [Paracoccus sp. R12_1]
MNIIKTALATTIAALAFSAPAWAQDAGFEPPEQCTEVSVMEEMDHSAMGHDDPAYNARSESDDHDAMPEHVQENMRRMAITMPAMEEGMMREDADVAFACAMIAHHQGAIDMAQVLLEHGDDPHMIELAGEIIAAQVGEIDQMTAWLAENAE